MQGFIIRKRKRLGDKIMKIMYDTDMIYSRMEDMNYQPEWMKAERLDYCEKPVNSGKGFMSMIKSLIMMVF